MQEKEIPSKRLAHTEVDVTMDAAAVASKFPLEKLTELWNEVRLQPGTLYLVGTPIGNAGDISVRALATLVQADIVLAEDTRTSANLLNQFEIRPRYLSYHKYNYKSRLPEVITYLKEGKTIAQISDAGMPAISDPGAELADACLKAGLEIRVVPGASAGVSALSLSGFTTNNYRFLGFLPLKGKDRQESLASIKIYPGITVIYEAPHRLLRTLEDFMAFGFADRTLYVGRELTKFYEESLKSSVQEIYEHFQKVPPRGEFVLVLDSASAQEEADKLEEELENLEAVIAARLKAGKSTRDILQELENTSSLSKNNLKKLIQKVNNSILKS